MLPPIEVFVGLDALRSSAEDVPGLPTRAELQQFLDEHDKIEKETEIFDSGELKKLRMFTKGLSDYYRCRITYIYLKLPLNDTCPLRTLT
jgi:hypothetical protein